MAMQSPLQKSPDKKRLCHTLNHFIESTKRRPTVGAKGIIYSTTVRQE